MNILDFDGPKPDEILCRIYLPEQKACFGGMLALNGIDGSILWKISTPHEIRAISCAFDLNGDHVPDCLGVGPFGTLAAVNSLNGRILWDDESLDINKSMQKIL